jgi:hypothetical protein
MICTPMLVLFSALARPGQAELEYHLVAGSQLGASDNPRAQSDLTGAKADGFVTALGQFDLSHVGRLTAERLSYGIMSTSWFRQTQSTSLTQTLRLSSEIQAGPETKLALSAGAMLARLSMIDTTAPIDPQTAGPRPAGDQYFIGVDASETLASQISGAWRVDQTLEGHWYRPLGSALGSSQNKSATLTADINHTWTRDWAGLRTRLGAITASGTTSVAGQTAAVHRTGEFAELALSWQHDWTIDFRHAVAAGAFALRADESRLLPAGSVSLLWHRTGHEIELRAARTADSNVFIGAAFERRLVSLRLALPIDRFELLRVFALADLEHDTTLATSAMSSGSANVVFVHLGISWQPGDMFAFGLEYTFRDQHASQPDAGVSAFSTFRRQTAMLTVRMQYPPSLAP